MPGLCCLYLLPDKLILLHALHKEQALTTITFIEVSVAQRSSLRVILDSIIKKHGLQGAACTWVLHRSYYQLLLLDPPAVEKDEVSSALKWQIKELINFPAQNAYIEYFPIPSPLAVKEKIYVAAAQSQALQEVADIISAAGLNLKYIDISELALRNINALYGDDQCYLGLLAFDQDQAEFMITHQGNLLVSRQLALPKAINADELNILAQEKLVPPDWLNKLISEIQHSFTYCQSQQQKELPTKFLLVTPAAEFATYLGTLLNMPAEQVQIEKKLNFEFVLPADEYLSLDYLIAIGAALRRSVLHARH